MDVIIECTKGTYEKYEIAPDGVSFIMDRKLKRKWITNYGFVPGTLQHDGDGLDAYIIGKKLVQGEVVNALPIALIYCIDNGKVDNKLVCAAPTAERNIRRLVGKIVHFIAKYKRGSMPISVTWKESNIRYEVAKCKAYNKLFRKEV